MSKDKVSAMEKEGMTQKDYLYLLRRCTNLDTLETIIHSKEHTLDDDKLSLLYSAADHRRVEIISGKLFDKIPKSMWGLIK